MRGYRGLITDEIIPFQTQNVSNIIQQGGTILKTARCEEFRTPEGRKTAYDNIVKHGITSLVDDRRRRLADRRAHIRRGVQFPDRGPSRHDRPTTCTARTRR